MPARSRSLAAALLVALVFALGCARLPPEATVPEPRATLLSAAMLAGVSVEDGTREADAPVHTPEDAWVGFRKLYPEEAKDCDGWARIGSWLVFSIRPEEKKQEAGFKTIVYVKEGTSTFRLFSPALLVK